MPQPQEPILLYEPVLVDPESGYVIYQAGAFVEEADALRVLATWQAEGRSESMAINTVPLFSSVAAWEADR